MSNISQGKILNYLDRVFGSNAPITADIFLTNYCNNNCGYCTYKRWDIDSGAHSMSYSKFRMYADRLKSLGVKGFILTGGGEPTVCKDFDKIAEWLTDNKLHWGINTNFNNIKYIKPDYLKVSLDGYDRKTYMENRGVDKYEDVIDNIIEYSKWKKVNSPNTTLGIQMLAKDKESVLKFYNAHKSLDVDYMSIRPVESTDGKYYIDKSYKDIVDTIDKLNKIDSRVVLNFKWGLIGVKTKSCVANWSQIAVNEFGKVMYCCHKPYEIVGDLMDSDILKKKSEFKTDMCMCDVPCRLTAPNIEVLSLTSEKKDIFFI